jgi:hypothetical protein
MILNCSANIIPHPALPVEESYRELCKLYVAMTRAKTELIISYIDLPSSFLGGSKADFTVGAWEDYADREILPEPLTILERFYDSDSTTWELSGQEMLFLPQAVGLSTAAQEKLIQLVSGTNRFKNKRQVEWKTFVDFVEAVRLRQTLRSFNGVSDGVWREFLGLELKIKSTSKNNKTEDSERRAILRLPKQLVE